jgi:hypothetical protein
MGRAGDVYDMTKIEARLADAPMCEFKRARSSRAS